MNYRTYLASAKNAGEFRVRFGDLARNARGWMDLSFDIKELPELMHTDLDAAVDMAVGMLRGFYNKEVKEEKSLEWRLRGHRKYKRKLRRKEDFKEDIAEYGLYDYDSEDYVPIIHGGDWGRIKAAILHRRGYATDVYMPNNKKQAFEKTGLMFHSEYAGRAKYYARDAAAARVGVKAILVAMVPRKYLYHNQGDEYSLPTWHYDKIVNYNILIEGEERFYNIEEYYYSVYCNKDILRRTKELLG